MTRRPRLASDPRLLPLIRVLSIAFFLLPLVRLLVFRATGFAVPISAVYGPYFLGALAFAVLRSGNWQVRRIAFTLMTLLVPPSVAYLVSVEGAGMGAILGSLWIYLVAPITLLGLGSFLSLRPPQMSPAVAALHIRRWLQLSTLCLLAGILVNALDAAVLGEEFYTVYKDYATAVPSLLAGISLPRLSGAYFSGLELTFAAILLLTLQRELDNRLWTLTMLSLIVAVALTFTRNSYVVLAAWLLARQLPPRLLSRAGGLGFLLMPVVSVVIALLLAGRVATGAIEASAETSSVLTRLASWTLISSDMISNPLHAVLGMGTTQNALKPGESDIYAIDNFFWELVCYGGAIAYIAFGITFALIRRHALRQLPGVGRIALVITAVLPVAGIFNNMASSILAQALFLFCGLFTLEAARGTAHFAPAVPATDSSPQRPHPRDPRLA